MRQTPHAILGPAGWAHAQDSLQSAFTQRELDRPWQPSLAYATWGSLAFKVALTEGTIIIHEQEDEPPAWLPLPAACVGSIVIAGQVTIGEDWNPKPDDLAPTNVILLRGPSSPPDLLKNRPIPPDFAIGLGKGAVHGVTLITHKEAAAVPPDALLNFEFQRKLFDYKLVNGIFLPPSMEASELPIPCPQLTEAVS